MGALTPYNLLRCYAVGHFPMANDRDDPTIYLVDPEQRGIIPLEAFHVPRSLRKLIRQRPFELRVNSSFPEVIRACSEPTLDRPRTWLNDELIGLYIELFELGHAHSVEMWREGGLVGGLYGVSLGAAFFGESMFSRERDASKVALVELVGRLRAGGFRLLDTQFVTDHLKRFGAVEISRSRYRERLRHALTLNGHFPTDRCWFADNVLQTPYPPSPGATGSSGGAGCSGSMGASQRSTQTS
jgi:leucyl/phenylalanyl-tRNA--protein transferase